MNKATSQKTFAKLFASIGKAALNNQFSFKAILMSLQDTDVEIRYLVEGKNIINTQDCKR
jgi:hypothetical protein